MANAVESGSLFKGGGQCKVTCVWLKERLKRCVFRWSLKNDRSCLQVTGTCTQSHMWTHAHWFTNPCLNLCLNLCLNPSKKCNALFPMWYICNVWKNLSWRALLHQSTIFLSRGCPYLKGFVVFPELFPRVMSHMTSLVYKRGPKVKPRWAIAVNCWNHKIL